MTNPTPNHVPITSPDDPINDPVDRVYDAFLPHMRAARRSYVRRRLGALLLSPVVLIAAVAFASSNEEPGAQVATETEVEQAIGEPTPEPEPTVTEEPASDEEEKAEPEAEPEPTPEPEPEWEVVDLGVAGAAKVLFTDGGIEVGPLELNEGWAAEFVDLGSDNAAVFYLTNGEVKLVATIGPDLEVDFKDISPEPEPEFETRKEIPVGDVGTVVVESDGEKLFLAVTWSHEWWEAKVVTESGPRVYAYFTNDGVKKHVEAWIEGDKIVFGVWATDDEPKDEKKEEEKKDEEKEEKKEEEEVQTRKKISVGDVGEVVVERDGDKLWLGVTWTHDFYDAVVVVEHGKKVHAYFTNDGVEHHVKAWIKGNKIKHEKWIVEPEIEPYDGSVTCGFGNVGILVEGNIARVMSVQEVEGVEVIIDKEVGEVVRIRFITEEEAWIMEAWGNGSEVVAECGQLE